jgi:hypothetical protein
LRSGKDGKEEDMRSSLVLATGLSAAVVAAIELSVDEVPVDCINMCGPMVELSGICNIGNPDLRRLKRRRVETRIEKRALANDTNGEDETIITTVRTTRRATTSTRPRAIPIPGAVQNPAAAIGTFNPVQATTTLNLRPTTTPKRIIPIIVSPTSSAVLSIITQSDDAVDDDTTTATKSANGPQLTPGIGTDDGGGKYTEEKKMQEVEEAAEAECICLNTSFDVKVVAPLCAACILQSGDNSSSEWYLLRSVTSGERS